MDKKQQKKNENTRLARKSEMLREAKELALLNTKLRTKMRRLAVKIAG